jgi:hypothetical protein
VREREGRKRPGILIRFGSGKHRLIGAGAPFGNGGDDFSWMDAWKVVPKAEARKKWKAVAGDVLLLEKTESASGWLGVVQQRLLWKQGSD